MVELASARWLKLYFFAGEAVEYLGVTDGGEPWTGSREGNEDWRG